VHHRLDFFQITNLMHNSFILQQYVCYITILNMFRAVPCSSSGGQRYIDFFSNYQLNAHFLYSSKICMLHYDPQHVSNSTLLIFRKTNCIITASGIVTLCKQPYSMQVERGLQSALNLHTVRLFTDSDDTRCCNNTICPPEDEQGTVRNMLKIVM